MGTVNALGKPPGPVVAAGVHGVRKSRSGEGGSKDSDIFLVTSPQDMSSGGGGKFISSSNSSSKVLLTKV